MNSCAKNGGAPRRRFPAIGEKPEGGCSNTPPGPARVKTTYFSPLGLPTKKKNEKKRKHFASKWGIGALLLKYQLSEESRKYLPLWQASASNKGLPIVKGAAEPMKEVDFSLCFLPFSFPLRLTTPNLGTTTAPTVPSPSMKSCAGTAPTTPELWEQAAPSPPPSLTARGSRTRGCELCKYCGSLLHKLSH